MTPIRTAARTLLGALFVGSGWMALRHPDRLVSRAKPVTDRMSPALQAANLPTEPETLVKVNATPNIKERRDCSAALFDAAYRLVTAAGGATP